MDKYNLEFHRIIISALNMRLDEYVMWYISTIKSKKQLHANLITEDIYDIIFNKEYINTLNEYENNGKTIEQADKLFDLIYKAIVCEAKRRLNILESSEDKAFNEALMYVNSVIT